MSDKYISIEPWWAGFANVRMSLEIGLAISELTNRKFIIPPGIYFNAINPWDKKDLLIYGMRVCLNKPLIQLTTMIYQSMQL